VMFHLFVKSFVYDFSRFGELLDFSRSCLPESIGMRNFIKVEFSDAISRKSARLRFSDIHKPSLRFLHRSMSFTLCPMVELHYVTTPELKCLFAMVCSFGAVHMMLFRHPMCLYRSTKLKELISNKHLSLIY
jgi:hypothetical protein